MNTHVEIIVDPTAKLFITNAERFAFEPGAPSEVSSMIACRGLVTKKQRVEPILEWAESVPGYRVMIRGKTALALRVVPIGHAPPETP